MARQRAPSPPVPLTFIMPMIRIADRNGRFWYPHSYKEPWARSHLECPEEWPVDEVPPSVALPTVVSPSCYYVTRRPPKHLHIPFTQLVRVLVVNQHPTIYFNDNFLLAICLFSFSFSFSFSFLLICLSLHTYLTRPTLINKNS